MKTETYKLWYSTLKSDKTREIKILKSALLKKVQDYLKQTNWNTLVIENSEGQRGYTTYKKHQIDYISNGWMKSEKEINALFLENIKCNKLRFKKAMKTNIKNMKYI